jgi:sugar phosphate permease
MTDIAKPSLRFRRIQWGAISVFLALEIALLAVDRLTVSLAAMQIRQEFDLTQTAIGALITGWSVAYASSQFAVGFLIDRFGPRRVLGIALFFWSAAQAVGGLALSYIQLMIARIALGAGEAPATPSAVRVVGTWFEPKERGKPTAIYAACTTLGPAIATPLLTTVMVATSWRVMFIIAGAFGMIVAVCWFKFYRDVHDDAHWQFAPEDKKYIASIHNEPETKVSFKQWARLFTCRSPIGLVLGSIGIGYMFWIQIGWLPTFLASTFHLNVQQTGLAAGVPWLGGVAGAACSGFFSDFLAKRGVDVMLARKIPASLGLFGMAFFTASAAFAPTLTIALVCLFLVLFFGTFTVVGQLSLPTVVAPRAYLGSAGSIANLGSYIGATCSPIITGYLVDLTGSFTAALLTGAGVGFACSALFFFIIKRPVTLDDLGVSEPAEAIPAHATRV